MLDQLVGFVLLIVCVFYILVQGLKHKSGLISWFKENL